MKNAVRQKCARYFEWNVQAPSDIGKVVLSDNFTFQDCKCRFKFCTGGSREDAYYSYIGLLSDGELQLPKTVILMARVAPKSDILFLKTKIKFIRYFCNGPNFLYFWKIGEIEIHSLLHRSLNFNVFIPEESLKGSHLLETNVHFEAMARDYAKLLDESSDYDVEVRCGDETLKVHRNILEARSPVFSAMLKSNMVEGETGLVKIEDIEAPIFHSFLLYIYSGTLPELNVESAKQFYEISDKYAVEELRKTCSEFLTETLSESNACEILVLADQHGDQELRKDVISYIINKKVPQRDDQWENFCENYCKLAIEVQNLYIKKYCPK